MSDRPTTIKLVYGLEEVKKELRRLKKSIRRNVLRRAARAGVVVIQKEARRRVPVRTGALRKAIFVRSDNTPYGVRALVYITSTVKVRKSLNRPGKFVRATGKGFAGTIYPKAYAHLVEFGAQPHRIGRGSERSIKVKGARRGPARNESGRLHPGARAKPFLRPAIDLKHEEAVEVFGQTLMAEVEKEIAKGNGSKRRKPAGVK